MPKERQANRMRVEWTEDMISTLIACRNEARVTTRTENPPRRDDGRKIGYMEIMRELFLKEYPQLDFLSSQNLRDKVSHAEKTLRRYPIRETVLSEIRMENTPPNDNKGDETFNGEESSATSERVDQTMYENVGRTEIEINSNLINDARKLLENIQEPTGDMLKRKWRTKGRQKPTNNDVKKVDRICEKLIVEKKLASIPDKHEVLWLINCIVYAAIVSWLLSENVNTEIKRTEFKPAKWLVDLDVNIRESRALLSQCVAERFRLTNNKRLTRKTRRNRERISKLMTENISVSGLTKLIEKLKAKIRKLAKSRKRKLSHEQARLINKRFRERQGRVFKDFKNIIDQEKDVEYPVYKELSREKRFFNNQTDVEVFWKSLWSKEDEGNPNVEWLREVENVFIEIVPDVHEDNIIISKEDIWSSIRRKRNWSAPGPDLIPNFWWKKLTSTHEIIHQCFTSLANQNISIPNWFSRGKTYLIPKPGEWSISNQRPITCTNTVYKWFTSLLLQEANGFLKKHQLMQIDQRGAKENCSGTVNNLLIDDMVLKDSRDKRKNLACAWIDVRKAYDSLSHSWIKRILQVHRFPTQLQKVISRVIDSWNVVLTIPVSGGDVESDPIKITNGVLQGDTICPMIYTLSKNPISWHLRRSEGYVLSKPVNLRMTHLLFIDDLKVFAKTLLKLIDVLSDIMLKMEDAGLEWNDKKCKVLVIKRGKVATDRNEVIINNMMIECLKSEDLYRFLGVPEAELHQTKDLTSQLTKSVQKRASVIWSSPLSDYHKVQATNIFVIPAVQYYMWTEKLNLNDLRDMDAIIRNVMNRFKAKYKLQLNSILYAPRALGGRGLKSFEITYKQTKVKCALNLLQSTDQRMKEVEKFDQYRATTNRSSIIRDAVDYATNDFGITLIPTAQGFTLVCDKNNEETMTSNKLVALNKIKECTVNNLLNDVETSTWQGAIFKIRWNDDDLVKSDCFLWLTKWKDCPVQVINDVHSIYLQTVPTLSFLRGRCASDITSDTCRLCRNGKETVRHILTNCGTLATSDYLTRHNRALQIIILRVLKQLSFIDKVPPWYSPVTIKPYYENEKGKVFWDIPEFSGNEDEDDVQDRVYRPDAKIVIEDKKKIVVIEMSVPWIENRANKYREKVDKYIPVLRKIQLDYPEYKVTQSTFIMDCLGGYSNEIFEDLTNIGISKQDIKSVLMSMQKVIISEAARTINKFKVHTYGGQL